MIQIIKELNIEVSKPNVFQAVVAKQYDMNTRFIKATFVDYGDKITIPQSDTLKVVINALRNDGLSKGFEGEINADGTVTVPLHSWMLELVGTVICDISVIDTEADDNQKLTTTSFNLIVEKAAWGGDGITSDPQYDVLIELLDRCASAGEVAEEALQKSNEANAKYDACVEATEAANQVTAEARELIEPAEELLEELVALRVDAGIGTYRFEDDVLDVVAEITTNGAIAYLFVSLGDVQLAGDGTYTFAKIPTTFAPFEERVLLEHRFGTNVEITFADGGDGYVMLSAYNGGSETITLDGTASATYDLANLRIAGAAEGGHITVDAELSDTSVNPVQNKVITELFNEASKTVANIGSAVTVLQTGMGELGKKTLPTVTTADNDKILQVVDGAWAAVAIADSAVKTYVDDYISSALEGEY